MYLGDEYKALSNSTLLAGPYSARFCILGQIKWNTRHFSLQFNLKLKREINILQDKKKNWIKKHIFLEKNTELKTLYHTEQMNLNLVESL